MNLTYRKPNRLKCYDYSQNGGYFITICVKDHQEMLGKITGNDVAANCVRHNNISLSIYGKIIDSEINKIDKIYDDVIIDKYCIMPNHIHMIIITTSDFSKTSQSLGRTQFAPTVSRIIKQFKGSVTKQIGFSLWQKSFYDHIIRNENEYKKIWSYIHQNPLKWEVDKYYINRKD